MRKDLLQLLIENGALRADEVPSGKLPTKADIVRMSEDASVAEEYRGIAKAIV